MLLKTLKQRTQAQHEQLERDLRIEDHLVDLGAYRRLLERWYGWYSPWEALAAEEATPEIGRFLQDRWKTPMLRDDLQALHSCSIDALPKADVVAPRDTPSWIGSMYVLEGSTLGGQLISRMIEDRLQFDSGLGYSFFRSYGEQVGSKWRQFREFAEERVNPGDAEAAVVSAEQTFQSLHQWLCPIPK